MFFFLFEINLSGCYLSVGAAWGSGSKSSGYKFVYFGRVGAGGSGSGARLLEFLFCWYICLYLRVVSLGHTWQSEECLKEKRKKKKKKKGRK